MFGLVLILVLATTMTFLNLAVIRQLVFLTPLRHALAPRLDRWMQDSVFQLQRRAFEAHGEGTWLDLSHDIPITIVGETLAELALQSLPKSEEKVEVKGEEILAETRTEIV